MKHSRHFPPSLRQRCRAGFTLAEIVVSMGVAMLLMDMVMQYYVENGRYMYLNEQQLTINKDMRVLTAQMSDDARYANFFVMYANYTACTSPSQELLDAIWETIWCLSFTAPR